MSRIDDIRNELAGLQKTKEQIAKNAQEVKDGGADPDVVISLGKELIKVETSLTFRRIQKTSRTAKPSIEQKG